MSSVLLRRAKVKHSHQKKVARTFDVRTRVQDARTFDVRTRVQDARMFERANVFVPSICERANVFVRCIYNI